MYLNFFKEKINLTKIFFIKNLYEILLIFFIFFILNFIYNKINIINHNIKIKSIKIGDDIMTIGGLVGKIYKFINDDYLLLALNSNQKIIINKKYIKCIIPKGIFNINI